MITNCNNDEIVLGLHYVGYAAAAGVIVMGIVGLAFSKVLPGRAIWMIVGWLLAIMLASRTFPEVFCSRPEFWTIHLTIQCVSLSIVLLLAGWGTYRWIRHPSDGPPINNQS